MYGSLKISHFLTNVIKLFFLNGLDCIAAMKEHSRNRMNKILPLTRPINLADAEKITSHRHRMFVDAGKPDDAHLHAMGEAFLPWVKTKIQANQYFGWFALDNEHVISGLGMMVIEWPPHPLHLEPLRGYILNVFTEPAYRGKGIAKYLTQLAMEEAKKRKLSLTILHATPLGKPLYEKLGFNITNEMQWLTDHSA